MVRNQTTLMTYIFFLKLVFFSNLGVEEAFLETARKIYQNIQDGSLDLNAAESGVQVILLRGIAHSLNDLLKLIYSFICMF